jgi:hypothetical protein
LCLLLWQQCCRLEQHSLRLLTQALLRGEAQHCWGAQEVWLLPLLLLLPQVHCWQTPDCAAAAAAVELAALAAAAQSGALVVCAAPAVLPLQRQSLLAGPPLLLLLFLLLKVS